ncbi:MAG: PDZ domain-containing protein [Pseudomonadota bacterium]
MDVLTRGARAVDEFALRSGIEGVVVLSVEPNGPADRAGLKPAERGRDGGLVPGDVIQHVNTRRIASGDDLSAALDDYDVGDEVTLTLWQDGATRDVSVTLAAP